MGQSPARRSLGRPPSEDAIPDVPAHRLESAEPRLTRIALALGLSPQDVPDVVQDALLAAHRARGSFDPARGSYESWLATILVRRVRNARRAHRRWRALRAAFGRLRAPRESAGGGSLDRVEARLVLGRLVSCLSDSQREVVALYEIGQLTADEVARTVGCTPAGVRSIARDARNKLAEAARRTSIHEGNHDDR